VLACFENIYQDLRRHGLLEQLLLEDYPTYELRIVGHSLGAGVSTLMGYVLKSKFPSLQVYGFSPPGCTMTWKLATDCIPWTTSFVLDNDIVPRLSVLALEDLRDEVLELVGRIKVPKYKVFETFLRGRDGRRGCLFGSEGNTTDFYEDDLDDLTHVIQGILDDIPRDTLYYRQVQEFLQVQHTRKESRGDTSSRRILFYPPGRMIHLLKTGEEGGCSHLLSKCVSCCMSNSGFLYTPVYISNDDLDEIIVNATMGTDHFIDRMCDELQKVASDYADQRSPHDIEAAHVHEMV
jgi:sn1-specific diacylglycerol lipase